MEKINFKPFQKVLVRDCEKDIWRADFFSHEMGSNGYRFCTTSGIFRFCIPFEGNQQLLGNDGCNEYVPKDGDFVYVKCESGNEYIFIKRAGDYYTSCYLSCHNNVIGNHGLYVCDDGNIVDFRPATDKEKQSLIDALHKKGKDWDAEQKKVVRMLPKIGDTYWYINAYLEPVSALFEDDSIDKKFINSDNFFFSEEECREAIEKIKPFLNKKSSGKNTR